MKLHEHGQQDLNTITAYGDDYVAVNATRHEGPLLIMPEGLLEPWPVDSPGSLTREQMDALIAHGPEIVLLGTGARQHFPHPRVTAPLTDAGIGHEVMTTASACRTYNILMSEGRRVLAALLPANA